MAAPVKIGFIGLGQMGAPIARRLLEAGHGLVAYDTRDEAVAQLARHGAVAASSAARVADEASLVFTCLPSVSALRQAVLGSEGVRGGSAVRTLVDLSTTGAQAAAELAQGLAGTPIALLDCPVSGGIQKALRGELVLMVSGPAAAYEAIEGVLRQAGTPFFLGEQRGLAQTMKLINNLLTATALAATAEAFVLGEKAGLPPQAMIDILNASTGRNSATQDKFPAAILPRTFRFGAATEVIVKDVSLYLAEAQGLGVTTDVAEAVLAKWRAVEAIQGPQADFTEIVRTLERQAGLT